MMRRVIYTVIFSLAGVVLTALGIDAADKYDRISESLVGRMFNGESGGLCPSDMVHVPGPAGGFCIDRYEASTGGECPVADPSSIADTEIDIGSPECSPRSVPGALPWRFVTKDQAARLCARVGKRLPGNREWQAAALDTPDPNLDWGPDDCQVALNWPEQPGRTGTGGRCQSPAGAFDLVGNVWEWVDETVNDGVISGRSIPDSGFVSGLADDGLPAETANESDPGYGSDYLWVKKSEVRAVARGGYWDSQEKGGTYSAYIVFKADAAGPGTGFRCAR